MNINIILVYNVISCLVGGGFFYTRLHGVITYKIKYEYLPSWNLMYRIGSSDIFKISNAFVFRTY